MARRKKVIYKDVFTGKVYEYLPKGKIPVSSLTDKQKRATFGNNVPQEQKQVTYNPETAEIVADEVELPEVEVIAPRINPQVQLNPRDTDQNLRHRIEVANADEQVKENTAFDKPLNFLSPTNYIGAAFDYYQGESPFWEGVYKGTSGIVPDNFAANNPGAATLINMLGDTAISYGLRTGYKGLNTYKVIGQGSESMVFQKRNPFTTHVIKHSTIPPEEMAIRNRVPRMLKSQYLGQTPEGLYIYKQPRAFLPKNPTAAMRTIAQDLARNQWFPSEYPNLQGPAFFNIKEGLVLNDLGETGAGQIGYNIYGRRSMIDANVTSTERFALEMEKHGGKLYGKS